MHPPSDAGRPAVAGDPGDTAPDQLETARRYLDLVKAALVDDLYVENEARIAHLVDCLARPKPVELPRLRDPLRHDRAVIDRLLEDRRVGRTSAVEGGADPAGGYAYAPGGRPALDRLHVALDDLRTRGLGGALVTCDDGRGGAGVLLRAHGAIHDRAGSEVWVVGRFRAAADDRRSPDEADGLDRLLPDLNQQRDAFARFGLLDDQVHLLQGDPDATLADPPFGTVALLHLGPGVGADAAAILGRLAPRLAPGAHVVAQGATTVEAVRTWRAEHDRRERVDPVGVEGIAWIADDAPPAAIDRPAASGAASAPPAGPSVEGAPDLSVVVVFHDMRREAARTLHSLSRTYQRDLDGVTYEVIAVDNGSSPEQRLDPETVTVHGPEFRLLDLGPDAPPSPVTALNLGIAEARGDLVALMIDGAHLLSPGVLSQALAAQRGYPPAVVAIQPFHLGPGQQGETMGTGYDQGLEDALLARHRWPDEGYAVFDISHFQGDRDWLDGMWESNCLFVPRTILRQVGGFDEGFATPGGGFANLDLYERVGAHPDTHLVTVLGEGSFHQVHGGTTTNQADSTFRRARIATYAGDYADLRGRPFSGPEKTIHYVGSFRNEGSKRTRARRLTPDAFEIDVALEGPAGPTGPSQPLPEDLREAFVNAYWRTNEWRNTRWRGRNIPNAPADLLAYQEILSQVRPDWVIETGTRKGGRAWFLAHVLDLIGHGSVLSIDSVAADDRPEHPRITYLAGRAHDDEVVDAAIAATGDTRRAVVILGTRGARRRAHAEFDRYERFVPVDSYLVMENTVLNGHPVDATFGPGPFEALQRILNTRDDFAPDQRFERHGVTFNPGGFLRRLR
jgi:cephalosporin hydroxylase